MTPPAGTPTQSLAILGGTPSRQRPFSVEPMVDAMEENLVLEAVRKRNFSRYIGMAVPDDVLTMPSAEAAAITDYWHFLGGENVRLFAAAFAEAMGSRYAIPVTSATAGISIALAAAGIGPQDEVIVPGISFSATANAVLMFGSIPVFVDVDPLTFCIDPAAVEAAVTPRTKAILPVHLAGNVSDMDALADIARRHGLRIIEDACQAIGASWRGRKTGTIGDAGVFSFQQSKNIMTGEGGMIITDDPEIAKRCRLILNHGELYFDERHTADDLANVIGFNFRMPELCAAVGRAQVAKLDAVNEWRTRNADILSEELQGIPGLRLPPSQRKSGGSASDVPHFFVALHDAEAMGISRDVFVAALRAEGIPIGTGYARPIYANPLYLKRVAFGRDGYPWTGGGRNSDVSYALGQCPTCERLLGKEFLWFYHIAYPSTADDMRDIGTAVRKVVDQIPALQAAAPQLANRVGGHSAGRIGVAPQMLKAK